MRLSTLWYCITQGFKNIGRNKLFSIASVGTISACIFLLCLFYAVVTNVQYIVDNAESSLCVTAFFDEDIAQDRIDELGELIHGRTEVSEVVFVSAEEAWERVKAQYFAEAPELAEGFEDDNPMANSASYEIYMKNAEEQDAVVEYLETLDGIRKVNSSSISAQGLVSLNNMVSYVSLALIAVLLCVSIFLISNTISIAITVRREEIKIMRLIGATTFLVRAPFIVEALIIGLIGAGLPLLAMSYVYDKAISFLISKLQVLSGIFVFLPAGEVFRVLIPGAVILGVGIGLIGSALSIRKHLRV